MMKRIKPVAFVFFLNFFGMCFFAYSAESGKQKQPPVKTVSGGKISEQKDKSETPEEIQAAEEQKILENLEKLKYSASAAKKQEALDYLFDHLDAAMPFLYDELIIAENGDLDLSNIFLLLTYAPEKLNYSRILESLEIQKNKSRYLQEVLGYLYEADPENTRKIIRTYFSSQEFFKRILSLKVIRAKGKGDFNLFLLESILQEKDPWIKEEILNVLSVSEKLTLSQAEGLLVLLGDSSQGVRDRVSEIFKNFPQLWASIQKRFKTGIDLFGQRTILSLLKKWLPDQEKVRFVYDAAESEFNEDLCLDYFMGVQAPEKVLLWLLGISDNEKKEALLFKIRATGMLLSRIGQEDQEKILEWYRTLLSDSKDEDLRYEVYRSVSGSRLLDEAFILFLRSRQMDRESWRNQKLIRQILDLTLEN